jgi:SAM-dependent methyltransferase
VTPRSRAAGSPELPEAAEHTGFYGIFDLLHRMELPATRVTAPYEGFHARVYEAVTRQNAWDAPTYVRAAAQHPGSVLELACGAGRLTLPLLKAGCDPVAMDRSGDMLCELRRRAERSGLTPPGLIRADIRHFCLHRTFDVILLGGLTACLLEKPADRMQVFQRAREHLSKDGVFYFDVIAAGERALAVHSGRTTGFPLRGPRGRGFTIVGWFYFARERAQVVNTFSEWIDDSGRASRFLSSLTTFVPPRAAVREELEEAGLRIRTVRRLRHREGSRLVDDGVAILACGRARAC